MGESVWSTWEPEDGRFELDWLEPVLGAAHRHDIGVILGTPTYAVPMWLARRYPDIAAETASGHRVGWGARQEVNFAHAAYRFHAERVIRAVVGRYREHPAIIGYQVDNEPGPRLLYNADVFEKFVDWLRRRYGTVDRLAAPSPRPNPTTTSRYSTTPTASSRYRRRGRCGVRPSSTPTPTGTSSRPSPAAYLTPSASSGSSGLSTCCRREAASTTPPTRPRVIPC
jgi:glycosyl hydrolase family 42 (putative beta-galactosidase)